VSNFLLDIKGYTMKAYIIIILFSITGFSQNYWEPVGLNNKSVGFITEYDGKLFASQQYGDSIFVFNESRVNWDLLSEIDSSDKLVAITSILFINSNNILATTLLEGNGIYKSTDAGLTWTKKIDSMQTHNFTQIINYRDTLFASSDIGLFQSVDSGESWTFISEDTIFIDDFVALSNNIFLAVEWADAYKSNDGGIHWNKLNIKSPHPYYKKISYSADSILYIGTNGEGVYKSTNFGETWEINIPPTYISVDAIEFNSSNHLIVGGEVSGCYLSTNEGIDWIERNVGLPSTFINAIYLDNDDFAYVGLSNDGIYKSIKPVTSIRSDLYNYPESYVLYQAFPNPFNPTTKIKYSLKDDGKVSLKIFNSLGEEVRTLVNEIRPAGNYEVEFNASNLPSGVYIYSIQAGEFVSSKKMILLK